MSDALLIGAQGWDHPEWHGHFYPEELPADWRLTYYNNLLRAVLAPGVGLENLAAGNVSAWAEDTDAGFRFVACTPLEFVDPAMVTPERVAEFAARLAPLSERLAGVLWRVAPSNPVAESVFQSAAQSLASHFRTCVDWQGLATKPEWMAMLNKFGLGVAWTPAKGGEPNAAGRVVVALVDEAQPRAQRTVLEKIASIQTSERTVAAFFATAEQAQQARTLAELMGV